MKTSREHAYGQAEFTPVLLGTMRYGAEDSGAQQQMIGRRLLRHLTSEVPKVPFVVSMGRSAGGAANLSRVTVAVQWATSATL
ncbi:unnamed protein product [Clonostachys chloroleuca]|uniref:Uncharacterized protein n=1 Tax=Clonostachys chloroleuca TaxID=1926264 RepID=A0AA35Q246_9HYPO|nr:unnamed protein product [Clonostachys chloroleuca]